MLQCFAELECKAHIFGCSSLIAMIKYLFESYASWLSNEYLIMWCESYLVEINVYLCATPIAMFLLLNIRLTNITILQAGTCSLNIEYVLKPCITINWSQIYINRIYIAQLTMWKFYIMWIFVNNQSLLCGELCTAWIVFKLGIS